MVWALTALCTAVAFLLLILYVAPTSKSNAETAHQLAVATALEKRQAACYDLFTAEVTDGNANTVVGMATLVVQLATPAPQRDQAAIQATIRRIDQSSRLYLTSIAERTKWAAAGRPLPCPLRSG